MIFFDNFQRAAIFIFFGLGLGGMSILSGAAVLWTDRCIPMVPKETCRLSHYEIRVHDITQQGSPIIGIAEGNCVYSIGEGRYKRYAMTEAMFTARNRSDYMTQGIEIPAAQSIVCEVK